MSFRDLLLVAATATRCPWAILSVAGDKGTWATLVLGGVREELCDAKLFAIVAKYHEPVEVTDPARNPALAHTRLAQPGCCVRWLLAVPLFMPGAEVMAVLAVLDTHPHERAERERAALLALARLATAALADHKAPAGKVYWPARDGRVKALVSQPLLCSRDVAALFDVTERTVISWAKSGKVPCLRGRGNALRFRSEDVLALMEAGAGQ